MRKIVFSLVFACAVLSFAACQKEVANSESGTSDGKDVTILIKADQSDATKTVLNSDNTANWVDTDKVTVLYKKTGESAWSIAESSAANSTDSYASAVFSATLSTPDENEDAFAIYPANTLNQDVADKAKITIPATQHPTATSFDGNADIMISDCFKPTGSTVSTRFARAGAVLKINIINSTLATEQLVSLSVTGANPLVGNVLVGLSDHAVKGIENGSNTVTAEYPANQFVLNSGSVYLIVEPQTLASDSHLIINGETSNYSFTRDITLENDIPLSAGHIIPLNITVTSVTLLDKVFFEERFTASTGTMGWSGNVALGTIVADNDGWTLSNGSGAVGVAKFGASSKLGSATTPSISIAPSVYQSESIKLSFKAGAWNTDSESTNLKLESTNCKLSGETQTAVTMVRGDWTEYTLDITSIDGAITIKFEGDNANKSRFFLDDVCVYYGTKPIEKVSPNLSFGSTTATAVLGDTFVEPTFNNPNSVAPLIWTSSNEATATVNENGIISAVAVGKTTVSASYAGDATYLPQVVSYELTVANPSLTASTPTAAPAGSSTSFDVTANIGWTATIGSDTDGIIDDISIADNTVTVTFKDQPFQIDKTAIINVNPTNNSLSSYAIQVTVTQAASGAETVYYTLTPETGGTNGYAEASDVTVDGITWSVTGNSTLMPWRIGGKSLDGVDRPIYSKNTLGKDISKVVVTHGAASNITVNSVTLVVSENSDFSNPIDTIVSDVFSANSTMSFTRPDGHSWKDCYFKFIYNVTVQGTSNKFLEFSQADFYTK